VDHEIHVYEGAPHSFFDRRQDQYKGESQDAWERILGFMSQYGAVAA
jgi:carboxymethylenebutenolidase